MEIIGEKINGTRQRVGRAVAERDAEFIRELAIKQAKAGAAYLDVNAGTRPETEPDDLVWLVETVQQVVEIPLCLDSPNPAAISAAIAKVERTPMINSINGEPERLAGILPLVARRDCRVIALAMDGAQIPKTSGERMSIIRAMIAEVERYNIPREHVYIDTLAMAIATDGQSGATSLQTMRAIRAEYPQVHLTCGLSNISFGLPARSWINRAFITLAIEAGLDSAILDPMDRAMQAAILSAELVLGRDRFSRNYTRAYRSGLFE